MSWILEARDGKNLSVFKQEMLSTNTMQNVKLFPSSFCKEKYRRLVFYRFILHVCLSVCLLVCLFDAKANYGDTRFHSTENFYWFELERENFLKSYLYTKVHFRMKDCRLGYCFFRKKILQKNYCACSLTRYRVCLNSKKLHQ